MGVTLFGGSLGVVRYLSAEEAPPEPGDLDQPTPWQGGDPEPVVMTVPVEEPEQTSTEAPPYQPIDDERPPRPGPGYVWVTGYWWWKNGGYVWVPGYWALPPEPEYVYIPGYWTYRGTTWVYVRGGWGRHGTTVVLAHPGPRRTTRVAVITAPRRIGRRHHRWQHHHDRRTYHRAPPGAPVRAPRPVPPPPPRRPRRAPRRW